MAKKKLYKVRVTVDLVVAAPSAVEATRTANSVVECDSGATPHCDVVELASPLDLPKGWDVRCLPFGDEDDHEIRDYLGI